METSDTKRGGSTAPGAIGAAGPVRERVQERALRAALAAIASPRFAKIASNPEHRILTAYQLAEGGFRVAGTVTAKAPGNLPPFESVRLDMAEIFPLDAP